MQAIVPAAGLGTRMLPFSAAASKELAPIGSRPAIQWLLEEAASAGIGEAVVVISPEKTTLRAFLQGEVNPAYAGLEEIKRWLNLLGSVAINIVEQAQPTGLGEALLLGRVAARGDKFYLMYPDNIVSDSVGLFQALRGAHESFGLSCVACKADKPYFPGNNFVIPGERCGDACYVEAFTPKRGPRPDGKGWRAAGRAIVTDQFFEALKKSRSEPQEEKLDDIDAYGHLAKTGNLLCLPPGVPIFDAGSPDGYKEAWQAFLAGSLL